MGGKKGATATAEATTEQSVNEVTTTAIQECYKNEHSESPLSMLVGHLPSVFFTV